MNPERPRNKEQIPLLSARLPCSGESALSSITITKRLVKLFLIHWQVQLEVPRSLGNTSRHWQPCPPSHESGEVQEARYPAGSSCDLHPFDSRYDLKEDRDTLPFKLLLAVTAWEIPEPAFQARVPAGPHLGELALYRRIP